MEMTLRLPKNYVEIEEEEIMYLDGGWRVTINRRTINSALSFIGSGASVYCGWTGKSYKQIIKNIGKAAIRYGAQFGKYLLKLGGFSSFWATALSGAFAGIVIASAVAVGVVYATNSSISFGF